MPPTSSAPPTTSIITYEVKEAFRELLRNYQKSMFAQIAYDKFVGTGQASEFDAGYYEHRSVIKAATNDLVENKTQAEAALGDLSHFKDNRTVFRQAGLLTGIDPEVFEDYRVEAEEFRLLSTRSAGATFQDEDIEYDTGVDYVAQPNITRKYSFMETTPYVSQILNSESSKLPANGTRNASNYSFFSNPAILQYLNNKAWQLSRGTSQTTGAPSTSVATSQSPTGVRMLLIGDSQTGNHNGPASYGDGVPQTTLKGWIGEHLQDEWYDKAAGEEDPELYVISTNGWGLRSHSTGGRPSQDILNALDNFKPTVVVIQLGANDSEDAYKGNLTKSEYHGLTQAWMDDITAAGISDVRWLGPSYATATKSWITEPDGLYENARQIVRDWVAEKANSTTGLTYYDMVPLTQTLTLQSDGVHFEVPDQYQFWSEDLTNAGAPLDYASLALTTNTTALATPTVPSDLAETYQQLALILAQDTRQLIADSLKVVEATSNNGTDVPELKDCTDPATCFVPGLGGPIYPVVDWSNSVSIMDGIIHDIRTVRMEAWDNMSASEQDAVPGDIEVGQTLGDPTFSFGGFGLGQAKSAGSQIFYANTHAPPLKALVRQHIDAVMNPQRLRDYDSLLQPIFEFESVPFPAPGTPEYEAGVQKEFDAILNFFGVVAPDDPLPDRPLAPRLADLRGESLRDLQEVLAGLARNLTPFDMQCYLMENIEELAAARTTIPAFLADYQHTMKLRSATHAPAVTPNILNHGAPQSSRAARIKEILSLCPDVYAALVPSIKIYRVEYNKDGSPKIDPDTRLPIENELMIPNFVDPADVAAILDGSRGRIPGAGIKSFSWSLEGVQPEEVDNNITAELVIYFQSINDFFRGASQAGDKEPNFLDLLINSPSAKRKEDQRERTLGSNESVCDGVSKHKHRLYEGREYRLKVVAGWSAPHNLEDWVAPGSNIDATALSWAIEQTKVSLYLTQVRHNLNFNEDGSLELTIDYQAGIAGLLTSPKADIFAQDIASHKDLLRDIDEELEEIDDLGADNRTSTQNERRLELLEEKKRLRQQNQLIKYRKLLEELTQPSNSKIHYLMVDPREFQLTPWHKLTEEQRAARAKRRLNPNTGTLEFADAGRHTLTLLEAIRNAENDSEANAAEEYSENETARYDQISNSSDTTAIPFFYLGDLIDNVIEQMKKNNGGEKIHFDMFLSDVDVINPLVAFQAKDLEEELLCGNLNDAQFMQQLIASDPETFSTANQFSNIMNIGDIPISLDAFQLFFKNKVVKPMRPTYYFLYFIKQLCAELVTRALGKACFGLDLTLQQRFDAQPVAYQDDTNSGPSWFEVTSESKVTELARRSDILPSTPTSHVRQGLVLMPTDGRPRNLRGDYDADFNRGIYHHYIGASCGLLKTLKFSREDQPLLREAKIQREGALGAEQLRELYSANLDLVGNNLYKNGMYIYINPTLLDADTQQLDYLGLHGYYLVTGVRSKLTPDGFDTNIDALHQAIEFAQPDNSLTMLNVIGETPPPERNPARDNRRIAAARHQARVDERAVDPTSAASRQAAEEELERERKFGSSYTGVHVRGAQLIDLGSQAITILKRDIAKVFSPFGDD